MAVNRTFLPTPESSVATWLIPKIEKHRLPTQSGISKVVLARVDVLALGALTGLGDVLIHAAMTAAKLGVAVVHIVVYPVWAGATPRIYLVEAGLHAGRSLKSLGVALVVTVPAAVLRPELAVSAWRGLGLAEIPKSSREQFFNRVESALTKAWNSPYRNPVLIGVALSVAGAVGLASLSSTAPISGPPMAVEPAPEGLLKTSDNLVAEPASVPVDGAPGATALPASAGQLAADTLPTPAPAAGLDLSLIGTTHNPFGTEATTPVISPAELSEPINGQGIQNFVGSTAFTDWLPVVLTLTGGGLLTTLGLICYYRRQRRANAKDIMDKLSVLKNPPKSTSSTSTTPPAETKPAVVQPKSENGPAPATDNGKGNGPTGQGDGHSDEPDLLQSRRPPHLETESQPHSSQSTTTDGSAGAKKEDSPKPKPASPKVGQNSQPPHVSPPHSPKKSPAKSPERNLSDALRALDKTPQRQPAGDSEGPVFHSPGVSQPNTLPLPPPFTPAVHVDGPSESSSSTPGVQTEPAAPVSPSHSASPQAVVFHSTSPLPAEPSSNSAAAPVQEPAKPLLPPKVPTMEARAMAAAVMTPAVGLHQAAYLAAAQSAGKFGVPTAATHQRKESDGLDQPDLHNILAEGPPSDTAPAKPGARPNAAPAPKAGAKGKNGKGKK